MLPETRIVLAPLAGGPSTPELAASVSNAGGLGFLGGAYLAPEQLREQLAAARRLTSGPLGVNLFVLRELAVDKAAIAAYAEELQPEARRLSVQLGEPRFDDDAFDAKLEIVLAAGVEVVSFTFGCPASAALARVRQSGAAAWLTVTSSAEARAASAAGADALVVQGPEAGGHRGTWDDRDDCATPLLELLEEIAGEESVPLVAAGGIADRRAVLAAHDAGAAAVQLGTAFLLCPEAGTGDAYRRAVAAGGETDVTRAFTGRRGRGIVNAFMRAHRGAPSAYPHVHHLTSPLRAAARSAGDADGFNVWAGTNVALARPEPAAEVVARLRA
ncbi:MAG TPA: nitronate monooxygenase [Gaiellaceae bacterium]|nr:nitronate monooxygenase [Gaiellaceae bacterium]